MFVLPTHVGSIYRVVATLVGTALLLWSVGFYSTAEAANVTQFSDTLSDSAPGSLSDHTIVFTTPTGVTNGQTITIDFSDGPFVLGSVDETDVDVASTTGDFNVAADCSGTDEVSASFGAGPVLTLTFCAGDGGYLDPAGTTTIKIGSNATFGGDTGNADAQMTNPAVGSYVVSTVAGADNGDTRVAIVDNVTVTASVETTFDFTITGLATSTAVNGTSTTGSTSPQSIPFGVVTAWEVKTLAQRLNVVTNARNGFVVTVEQDQNLLSSTGADIDGFIDGGYDNTPVAWQDPANTILQENTYGHWGLTSEDDLNTNEFSTCVGGATGCWVAASTTPREIFEHNGPSDGTSSNIGSTTVGYQIEISPLQEAGDDYTTTLTYIATPTF
ncbi:hypothetical protein KC723_00940 [Candidatus Kaiserbacteria bacterium]|nr:hypothetical protein [Candidatus Kaiserbacteria bacterium]